MVVQISEHTAVLERMHSQDITNVIGHPLVDLILNKFMCKYSFLSILPCIRVAICLIAKIFKKFQMTSPTRQFIFN